MSHAVFISYTSKDKGVAEAVCRALEDSGVRCWMAPRDVLPGMEYAAAIIDALNTCQVFLVIFSETSNSSPQVAREAERAISKNRAILTLRIDDTALSRAMEYYLSDRHWLDASGGKINQQMGNLVKAVKAILATQPQAPNSEGLIRRQEHEFMEAEDKERREAIPSKADVAIKPARRDKSLPLWRMRWVFGIIGTVAILLLGAFFLPRLWAAFSPPLQKTPTAEPYRTTLAVPTLTATQQPPATAESINPIPSLPADLVSLKPVLTYVTNTSPDFADDFSNPNNSWDPFQAGIAVKDGVLDMVMQAGTPTEKIGPSSKYIKANNFWLEYDFFFTGSNKDAFINDGFPSTGDGSGINFDIRFDLVQQDWFLGLTDNSIEKRGPLGDSMKGKWSHLLIIYYNKQVVVFLNGEHLSHVEGILKSRDEIWIIGTTAGQAEIWLDNLKFWDLDKIPTGP